jgi:mercuric ion transport protein
MMEIAAKSQPRENGSGAVVATMVGLGAAFGLASCCALPLLLYSVLGTAWLMPIALTSLQYRSCLICAAVIGLGAGAFLLWRQQKADTCAPGAICARPWVRALTGAALLVGLVMLYYGYTLV